MSCAFWPVAAGLATEITTRTANSASLAAAVVTEAAARTAADQVFDVVNVPNEEVSSNLFPNPASDMTVLSIEGTTANETWTVSIADISGRVISTTTFVSNEGISEHRISVSDLSYGIYQIVATNGSNKIVQKLVH